MVVEDRRAGVEGLGGLGLVDLERGEGGGGGGLVDDFHCEGLNMGWLVWRWTA